MEHVVQFGVTVDDEKIAKQAEESATKIVANEISRQIFNLSRWTDEPDGLNSVAEELIKNVIFGWKDEIVASAVEIITTSIRNSKKFKEAVEKVVEEVEQ